MAIDLDWIETKGREVLSPLAMADNPKSRAEYLNGILGQIEKPVVVLVYPLHNNERAAAQQGFFLCNLIETSFEPILMSMMMHPDTPERPVVRKLEVPVSQRVQFLKHLAKMNIDRASLFPGLDGYCRKLRLDLEIKVRELGQQRELSISDLERMLTAPTTQEAE